MLQEGQILKQMLQRSSVTPSISSIPFRTTSVNLTAVTSSATTSWKNNVYAVLCR